MGDEMVLADSIDQELDQCVNHYENLALDICELFDVDLDETQRFVDLAFETLKSVAREYQSIDYSIDEFRDYLDREVHKVLISAITKYFLENGSSGRFKKKLIDTLSRQVDCSPVGTLLKKEHEGYENKAGQNQTIIQIVKKYYREATTKRERQYIKQSLVEHRPPMHIARRWRTTKNKVNAICNKAEEKLMPDIREALVKLLRDCYVH